MDPVPRVEGLLGLRGWHASFVLFLAFLVPVSPLLAEIQRDAATRNSMQTAPAASVAHSPHRYISSYLVFLDLFSKSDLPIGTTAPWWPGTDDKACQAGRVDAERETSGTLWFLLGFCTTIWGPVLAYSITPSVPETKLNGRNAKFVSSYTECYQDLAKDIHVKWAWYGVGALAVFCLIVFAIVALGNKNMSN